MADQNENQTQTPPQNNSSADSKLKYFKSRIAGLSVQAAAPGKNDVAPKRERFTPILVQIRGEDTKLGLLKTSDSRVIQLCMEDPEVQTITKDEYEQYFSDADDPDQPNVRRVAS